MKSKYLYEIGIEMPYIDNNDERQEQFKKEIEEYGLASYDTWNFDVTFVEFLYIGFKMYNERNCIDTHFHKFIIDNEEWDMQQCIDYIINESKNYLLTVQNHIGECKFSDKFFEVLQKIIYFMWW